MSVYILNGADQFRAREALAQIREELDKDGSLANSTTRLDGVDRFSPADLRSACHTVSFFAENRLVIVENLMKRLSGTRRRGRRATTAAKTTEQMSEFDQFVDVLQQVPPTTTVVILEEDARSLIEALGSSAQVREFPVMKAAELRNWVSQRAKAQGASFSPNALERLVSSIDGNFTGELAQEIDKLSTYAGGQTIQASDVDEMVSGAVKFQIWDLTDAIVEGRADRALGVLRGMDAKDQPPQLLMFMIVRQYRQLILAQALIREGRSQDQIGKELGIFSSYPLRKVIDQASRYPVEGLEKAYRSLLQADVAVKTGVMDVDTALQMLIVELTEIAKGLRPATSRR